VGDEHGRDPEVGQQPLHLGPDLDAQDRVQVGERLVQQQHRRACDQRPGQGDPLSLAAGQAGRQAVAEPGQVDQLQGLGDPVPPALLPRQAVADVAGDGQVGEQGAVLEHHPDPAALGRDKRAWGRQVPAVEPDPAGVGPLQPGDAAQQGRLAAAAGPSRATTRPAGASRPAWSRTRVTPKALSRPSTASVPVATD
jgi:hypothetical protein